MENTSELVDLVKDYVRKIEDKTRDENIEREPNVKEIEAFKSALPAKIQSLMAKAGVNKRFLSPKSDVKNFDLDGSYYIFGGVGTGKTDLAVALLREIILNTPPAEGDFGHFHIPYNLAVFVSAPEMFLNIRSGVANNEISELELVKKYTEPKVLILDDLGTEKLSEWVLQTLYVIVNARYENMLQTIITSNYTLAEIKNNFHERIASRIKGMCELVELKGQDKRQKLQVIK